MADDFSTYSKGFESPPDKHTAIALSTAHTTLSYVSRAIYVGAGGNLVCTLSGTSEACTYVAVPTGKTLVARVAVIHGTTYGTNVASLVAMW